MIRIDHLKQAKEQVISQYENSIKLNSYIGAIVIQDEELESVVFDLLDKRHLDVAVGEQLDVIGRKIGISRTIAGAILFDAEFKLYIRMKILKNITSCTIPQLTKIYILIFGVICHIQESPGVMQLLVGRELTTHEKLIIKTKDELGRYILPKVLGISLVVTQFDPVDPFAYVGFPNAKGYDVGKYSGGVI